MKEIIAGLISTTVDNSEKKEKQKRRVKGSETGGLDGAICPQGRGQIPRPLEMGGHNGED